MALSVFAVLTVIVALAVAWGSAAAVALRQSQQLTVEQTGEADVWAAEADAEPGWAITPAHMRMW
jgi:hypothetical protein